jgi:hypothetical protein
MRASAFGYTGAAVLCLLGLAVRHFSVSCRPGVFPVPRPACVQHDFVHKRVDTAPDECGCLQVTWDWKQRQKPQPQHGEKTE